MQIKNLMLTLMVLIARSNFASADESDGEASFAAAKADFEHARECSPVNGQQVWVGKLGYYVYAWPGWTGDEGLKGPDGDPVAQVPFADNKPEDVADLVAACK